MRGLYAIIDLDSLQTSKIAPLALATEIVRAHPPILQLRAKSCSASEALAVLRGLVPICRATQTLLVMNDRVDLALLAGVDAVHIGQDDLPISEVRRIAPGLRAGISTHDLDQLERALELRPDYVAYGPVFPTRSKSAPDPVVGVEGLALAAERARAVGCPLVAIGGIDLARAPLIAAHADLGAVISALIPEAGALAEVAPRARVLHAALGGAA
jgi:thiamine-phosphate pyrophosphorylase